MSIRNIITTSALVALFGTAGAVPPGSAFANDSDIDLGADAPAVQVSDTGYDFSLGTDSYVEEGDFAENVDRVEEANLLDTEFDAVDIN